MIKSVKVMALVAALSAILAGCAAKQTEWRPSAAEIETADYGAYPPNYERIMRDWYLQNLKDPDSAKFGRITRPLKEHMITNKFEQEAVYGFSVCAEVNAKNSYGGYTGYQTRWLLIRNGRIMRSDEPKHHIYIGRPYRCIDGPLQG